MKKTTLLIFLSLQLNLIYSQCNEPVIFPILNGTEAGKLCLEGIPSPLNDICLKNNSGSLNFLVNNTLKYNFEKEGNFFQMLPTSGDAIIQRGSPGNLVINSGGNNSRIYLNYAASYNAGNQGIRLFDGGEVNYTSMKMIQTKKSSTSSYLGGTLLIAPSNSKVVIGYESEDVLTPDGYKLFVTGGILSEKFKAALKNTTQWSDHVFEKDYQLMPLEQVESFIKENNHLPNLPSANELVMEGLDLAEMQAKQMEKIEELTLYVIEMKKEIERLKIENVNLKEQLSKN